MALEIRILVASGQPGPGVGDDLGGEKGTVWEEGKILVLCWDDSYMGLKSEHLTECKRSPNKPNK